MLWVAIAFGSWYTYFFYLPTLYTDQDKPVWLQVGSAVTAVCGRPRRATRPHPTARSEAAAASRGRAPAARQFRRPLRAVRVFQLRHVDARRVCFGMLTGGGGRTSASTG